MAENEIKTESKVERENEPDETPDKNGNESAPVGHGMAQGHFSSEIYKIEIANIPKATGIRLFISLYLLRYFKLDKNDRVASTLRLFCTFFY